MKTMVKSKSYREDLRKDGKWQGIKQEIENQARNEARNRRNGMKLVAGGNCCVSLGIVYGTYTLLESNSRVKNVGIFLSLVVLVLMVNKFINMPTESEIYSQIIEERPKSVELGQGVKRSEIIKEGKGKKKINKNRLKKSGKENKANNEGRETVLKQKRETNVAIFLSLVFLALMVNKFKIISTNSEIH